LIISGRKTIEVRSWTTEYRGTLWLHTGSAIDVAAADAHGLGGLFTGGYIGTVDLVAIVSLDASRWEMWRGKHLVGGAHRSGQFAWVLDAPRRLLMPIKGPGYLGLFRPDQAVVEQLELSLKARGGLPS
jgi:hypothetical protein